MELFEGLTRLGFARNDARLYAALFQYGPLSAPRLSRELHMHRRNVYDALEKLAKRGLVRQIIKNRKRLFEVCPPSRIADAIKERQEELKEQVKLAESVAAEFARLKAPTLLARALIYEGKDGLKDVFDDILATGADYVVYGSPGMAPRIFRSFIEDFTEERCRRRIRLSIIYSDAARKRGEEMAKKPFTKVRFMPERFCSPSETIVYGNKTAIVQWAPDFFAVVIESKETAHAQKGFFEQLWKMSKAY
ncbi:MAG: helix-turn-helix domain-containing protein [Candidatus Micrarchaeota archaeon]